ARGRNPRGDLDGVVQVARLDQVVAAELLFRLRERPVGGRRLPVAHAHRRRGRRRLERVAAQIVTALLDALGEGVVLAHHLLHLGLGRAFPELLVAVDQAQVFHWLPPRRAGGAWFQ